jgi:hypothetical protein
MMCGHVAMTDSIEHYSAGLADDPNDDTIELLLSPHERLSLSRAAAEAPPPQAAPVDSMIAPPDPPPHPAAGGGETAYANLNLRWPRIPFEVATVLAVMAIALASAAYRSAKTSVPGAQPTSAAIARTSPGSKPVYAEPESAPVRVKNPFDASETFEFPPGTSAAAARKSVANLLLERGRDRLDQSVETRRDKVHRADRSN